MPALRPFAVLAALLPLAASAHPHGGTRVELGAGCTVEKGPDDLVSKDALLVVPEGARADEVISIGGDVVVKRGAVVQSVASLGGNVRIEGGAVVNDGVAAVGGDVTLDAGAKVRGDAVAVGGQLRADDRSEIGGDRVSLSFTFGGFDLKQKILDELHAEGCVIELEK